MGLIGLATRAGKIVFGTDACLEQIIKRNAKLVIVAKDASERTIKNIKNKCIENNVMFYNILTVNEISKCIGKDVVWFYQRITCPIQRKIPMIVSIMSVFL